MVRCQDVWMHAQPHMCPKMHHFATPPKCGVNILTHSVASKFWNMANGRATRPGISGPSVQWCCWGATQSDCAANELVKCSQCGVLAFAAPEHISEHRPAPEQNSPFLLAPEHFLGRFVVLRSTLGGTLGAPEHFPPEHGKICLQHCLKGLSVCPKGGGACHWPVALFGGV